MSRRLLVVALCLVGCGDNTEGPAPDAPAGACAYTPPAKPLRGFYADPLAIELPATCVVGGLADLPGRWFMQAPDTLFDFFYPKFEGDCSTGFQRANYLEADPDDSDGRSFDVWSDGTRYYQRQYLRFENNQDVFEYAVAFAACMQPDGTLVGVSLVNNSDTEVRTDFVGTRFAPKDTGGLGLTLVGELGGTPDPEYNLVADGRYLYAVGPEGFDVIDVVDPAHPVVAGHVDGEYNDVKFYKTADRTTVYAAPIGDSNTAIIDVTTPTAPLQIGFLPSAYSHSVFITPATTPPKLYLANYTASVPIYDITNPILPVRLGAVPIAGDDNAGIHDIHVDGSRIYVDKTTDGVVAVDVTAGLTSPTELGRIVTSYSHATWAGMAGGRKIAIHGDEGMSPEGGAYMRVIDADETSATFMQVIGTFQSRPEVGIHNMILVGDKAIVAYYHDGVRIIDLADPTHPTEVGHYNTWNPETARGDGFEGAIGIAIVGDLIYVADSDRGVLVLRLDPTL